MIGFLVLAVGSRAQAQIAYIPGVGFIPSGQTLTVTPVVSADRRYVRLTVNPFFNALNGFQTFNVFGAVGGGNFGGALGGLGGAGGGLGGAGGGFGGAGGGFGAVGVGFAGMNGAMGASESSFSDSMTGLDGRAPGRPVPAGGESLAGGYFAPPEGLIKGDPFSLDSIEQNGKQAKPEFPFTEGEPQTGPGFPEDAFAEEGGPQLRRSTARAVKSQRAKNARARSTAQRSRAVHPTKPKKSPKAQAQSAGVESK